MKAVEEKKITGEIDTEELINFLVEELYIKYPPFMNLFGNDKEKMKQVLRDNICTIEIVPEERDEGVAAIYNITKKTITFFSKKKIDIDDIRRDSELQHIFVHESIHAIFSRARTKKTNNNWLFI